MKVLKVVATVGAGSGLRKAPVFSAQLAFRRS